MKTNTPTKRAKKSTELTAREIQELEHCRAAISYVEARRAHRLTFEDRLHALRVQAAATLDRINFPRIPRNVAAYLLGRSTKTIHAVWKEFLMTGALSEATDSRNSQSRRRRFDLTPRLLNDLREFIRQRAADRERTVAKDVLFFLVEMGHVTMAESDPHDFKAALRSVQRLLVRQGYKRGKRKGVYRLSAAKAVLRDDYVLKMAVDPGFRGRRKVYIDESYIHHNYSRHQDSLYDPTDPNATVERHKGRRYCFIAAIIDGDPNSDGEGELLHELEPSECDKELDRVLGVQFPANSQELSIYSQGMAIHPGKSQLLMDTFKFFEGSKQTKDYHGMFNHDYFVAWMEKLLRALERRGIRNCVIVMDNAKYHKKLPAEVPRKKDAKAIILHVTR